MSSEAIFEDSGDGCILVVVEKLTKLRHLRYFLLFSSFKQYN